MSHLAVPKGVRDDDSYQQAYWRTFEGFFGKPNSAVVKAMLLAKHDKADTGDGELDRVCFGLRQTMGWLAEAIERKAIAQLGEMSTARPRKGKPRR